MYREIIHDGDVILQRREWWTLGLYIGWRNLSQEVRNLKNLEQDKRINYEDAKQLRVIAECNVSSKKSNIKRILGNNTQVIFFSDDNSILDKWDGVSYIDKEEEAKKLKEKMKKEEEEKKKRAEIKKKVEEERRKEREYRRHRK